MPSSRRMRVHEYECVPGGLGREHTSAEQQRPCTRSIASSTSPHQLAQVLLMLLLLCFGQSSSRHVVTRYALSKHEPPALGGSIVIRAAADLRVRTSICIHAWKHAPVRDEQHSRCPTAGACACTSTSVFHVTLPGIPYSCCVYWGLQRMHSAFKKPSKMPDARFLGSIELH